MSGERQINPNANESLSDRLDRARSTAAYQAEYLKETFSDELWRAMEYRSLTQVDFAARASVSKQFLTKVFRGANCTEETMAKLSHALQYKIHLHLTPNELECDWFEFLKEPPRRYENDYVLAIWGADYQPIIPVQVNLEVKYESVSGGD